MNAFDQQRQDNAPRAVVRVLGCKANQYDAQLARTLLEQSGYVVVDRAPADVVVVHSCAVTEAAAAKTRQQTRRWLKCCPGARVIVSGCAAAAPGFRLPEGAFRAVEPGPRWLADLARVLPPPMQPPAPACSDAMPIDRFQGRTRAFIKVQDGCDGCCAYCIVPQLRGPSRSRSERVILDEARALAEAGHREVVVCGVSLGCFGGAADRSALARLLRRLAAVPGIDRLRLSSLHPADLTDELLEAWRDTPAMAPHVHLPLQSGSDAMLAAMRRGYSAEDFLGAIARVRAALDRPVFTTDVIAGFPGETAEDFAGTLRMLRAVRFARVHVFPFSVRSGTAAADLDPVAPGEAARRAAVLREQGAEIAREVMNTFTGSIADVLVERRRGRDLRGTSARYFSVAWSGDARPGELVPVRLEALPDGVFRGDAAPAQSSCEDARARTCST